MIIFKNAETRDTFQGTVNGLVIMKKIETINWNYDTEFML